jgi:glycosyltransferase involved in cell wall biosynthesis
MRILYMINAPGERLSGAGKLTMALAAHRLAQGDQVFIAAPPGSGIHDESRAIGAQAVSAPMTALPWEVARLRRTVRELGLDVVHAMSFAPLALAGLTGESRPARPRTFASIVVDPSSPHPVARRHFRRLTLALRNAVARRRAPRVDALFPISTTIAKRLEDLGIHGNAVVARGTLDTDDLRRRGALEITLPPGSPVIGTAAVDLAPFKGIQYLLRAFVTVLGKHPRAVLLVSGHPHPDADLVALAHELGIEASVHFLGFLPDQMPFIARLDVYALPSLSEALNTSVLEAQAVGVPVVTTNVGGMREAVDEGRTGLLVPPGDSGALADAVLRLIEDRVLAEQLANRGRSFVETEFDIRTMFEITDAAYERAQRGSAERG